MPLITILAPCAPAPRRGPAYGGKTDDGTSGPGLAAANARENVWSLNVRFTPTTLPAPAPGPTCGLMRTARPGAVFGPLLPVDFSDALQGTVEGWDGDSPQHPITLTTIDGERTWITQLRK
jgi:hypothetical protein